VLFICRQIQASELFWLGVWHRWLGLEMGQNCFGEYKSLIWGLIGGSIILSRPRSLWWKWFRGRLKKFGGVLVVLRRTEDLNVSSKTWLLQIWIDEHQWFYDFKYRLRPGNLSHSKSTNSRRWRSWFKSSASMKDVRSILNISLWPAKAMPPLLFVVVTFG